MTQRNYAQSTQLEPGSGAGPPPVYDLAFVSGTQTISGVTTTDATFDGNPDIQFTRTVGAGVLADGSNSWYAQVNLIQEVGNASTRFRLQRINSSGVVQSSSAYSAEQSSTGLLTLTTTWDCGTWAAGDRLVLSIEFRQSGGHVAAGFNIGRPQTYINAPDQLPVSGVGIGEGSSVTSASTDLTTTPPANELLVADLLVTSGSAIPTPTMSGWGGTWELVRATGDDTDIRRAFRFRSVIASPTSGVATVDFGATTVGNISIRVVAVHDAKTTNNGADAFVRTLHRNLTTAATRTYLKLQNFSDANNIGLFNAIGGQTEPMTVEGSWVKDFEYHGGIAAQVTAFLVGGANEAAINWTNTGHHLMIASEIAVAGSADPPSPLRVTRLAQGLTNAGSGLWQTASVAPAADRLLVFAVQGPNSDVPTPSGWSLTWSQVSPNVGYDTAASPSRRLTLFVAKTGGSAPGSDTADAQFAGTPTVVNGSLFEVEGIDLASSAAANVVQAVAEAADAATSIGDTLSAFGATANGTMIFAISDNLSWNYPEVGDGFELLDSDGQGDEPKVAWRYSNDTTPSFDTLSSADVGFLAIEVKADAGGISGTVAVTQDNQTSSASGTVEPPAITGTASIIQDPQVSTASGTHNGPGVEGTTAVTQDDQTSSASGAVVAPAFTGTTAATQEDDTSSASGTVAPPAFTGTSAATQDAQTSSASGTVGEPSFTGTLGVIQQDQFSTASGTVVNSGISGSLAASQENQVAAASGTFTPPAVTGTASSTQDDQTANASGTVTSPGVAGTSASVQDDQTSTASGTVTTAGIAGSLAVTQDDQTSTATGNHVPAYSGTLAVTQDDQVLSASGIEPRDRTEGYRVSGGSLEGSSI